LGHLDRLSGRFALDVIGHGQSVWVDAVERL
jgi:hypothetical protein